MSPNPERWMPLYECEQVTADHVGDDHVLGLLLLVIGGIRVALALAAREIFAGEATVALLMVVLAIGLLRRRR